MRVQRLVMPSSGVQSWTLLGRDHVPVVPVERFLAYLAAIDRSPNTIRAYAHDLKDWFVFLSGRGVDWRSARLEDVGAFAGWYCGLPVQKSCPHANACLTCPVFLTGPEFLPELRAHRGRTLTLIQTAETAGQARVAQMNQHVLNNLDRMIEGVQTPDAATDSGEVSDAF